MENFEREEEINHLVNTLMDGMNDETLMDYDCIPLDSNEEIMDEKVNSLGCHYSDISSPEASSSEGKKPPLTESNNECLHTQTLEQIEWKLCHCRRQLVQMGGSADENQRESESEEQQEDVPMLAGDELTTDVFNFPHTFFQLTLKRTKSFKHKQQSYTVTLKENARTDPHATLGDIHNQLYLIFHSVLEEMYNVYTSYDLVRIFITHKEMVNTNIVVGPDYLGNINADIIMNQIADVVHSNNFIPSDYGLEINITAICNVKGLRYKMIKNLWKDIIDKHCLMTINNDDELCLPRAITVPIA